MRATRRACSVGNSRPGDAAILRRVAHLGRDRRAHGGKPVAPTDGVGAVGAGRLQEPYGRQRASRRGRHHRRGAAAQVPLDLARRPRRGGRYDRQSALPSRFARGFGPDELRRGQRSSGRRDSRAERAATAIDGGLQSRQQWQRSPPANFRGSRRGRSDRRRLARHLRCDAGEQSD